MQIHYGLNSFKALNPVVTIGTFDGVHLGHREVISELRRICALSGGESVIFTFEPHPRIIIAPQEDSLRLLTTQDEKISLIEKLGVDHLVVYPFTKEFARLSYHDFVTNILVDEMNISSLVVGYDHRFGQGRKGDFSSLELLSQLLHFKVEQLSQLLIDNKIVSSTKIRMALDSGDVVKANRFLGYRYSLSGKVIAGNQLGRKLGFPTANIESSDRHKLIPRDGVYAVMVKTGDRTCRGMLNVGIRPTVNFNVDHKSIEVYIFDFDEDIYHTGISVFFVGRIRDEQKFADLDQLREQMKKDQIIALKILADSSLF